MMIQDGFQIELPLMRLFEATTVADLARSLAEDPELAEQTELMAPLLLELVSEGEEVVG